MNTVKRSVARFIAIILFIVLALYAIAVPAFADPGDDDPEDEPIRYEKVYYFSDYSEGFTERDTYIATVAHSAGLTAPVDGQYVSMCAAGTDFDQVMKQNLSEKYFNGIKNSIVIFEKRNGLFRYIRPDASNEHYGNYIPEMNYRVTLTTDDLYEIFGTLKGNGCKIMLILGTDEVRFVRNETDGQSFLQFVDFHINTDIFYTFWDNVCMAMEAEYVSDIALLLGGGLCYDWFFDEFLIPYTREYYLSEITNNNREQDFYANQQNMILTDEDLLNSSNLSNFENWNNRLGNILYDYSDRFHVYERTSAVFPVAHTGVDDLTAWTNCAKDAQDYTGDNIYSYLYEANEDMFLSGYAGTAMHLLSVLKAGSELFGFDVWLQNPIEKFILNGDIMQFHNYNAGICTVSHYVVMRGGFDGWMQCARAHDYADINMTAKQYGIYFGSYETAREILLDNY